MTGAPGKIPVFLIAHLRLIPGLWDRGMASGARVQIMIEKNPVWQTVVWPLALQKPGLSNRGVANGVAKFRMASGGLS